MANTGDVYGGYTWQQLQAQTLQWAAQARLQQQQLTGYMGGTEPTRQEALRKIFEASPDLKGKYASDKSKKKGDWLNWLEKYLADNNAREILSDPVDYARRNNLIPAASTDRGPATLEREQMMKNDQLQRWTTEQQTKLQEWDRLAQIGWSREQITAQLGFSREELDKNLAWSREEQTKNLAWQRESQANQLGFSREELAARTGQDLLNTFSQLRGPENYFQYWNTQRAAQGSPNLAWAQALTGNAPMAAFQQGGPYQAATLGGLVNQTPSGAASLQQQQDYINSPGYRQEMLAYYNKGLSSPDAAQRASAQQGLAQLAQQQQVQAAGVNYNPQQAYDTYLQQRPAATAQQAQGNSWYDQLLRTQINPQKIGQQTWNSMAPSEQAGTKSLIEAQGGDPNDWANTMQKSWMRGGPTTQRTQYRW